MTLKELQEQNKRTAGTKPAVKGGALSLAEARQASGIQVEAGQQQEPGLLQSLAQGVTRPYLRAGLSVSNAVRALGGKKATDVKDFGYLGQVPRLKGPLDEGSQARHILESVGVGTEIASDLVTVGGVKQLVKPTLKGLVSQGFRTGARSGFVGGTLAGLGIGLQKEDATVGSVAMSTATGSVLGTAGGAALGALTPLPVAAFKGIKNAFDPTSQAAKLADQYDKVLNPSMRQRGVEAKYNKNTAKFLAQEGVQLHTKGGKLDPTQSISDLTIKYRAEDDVLNKVLAQEPQAISFRQYGRKAQAAIDTEWNRAKGTDYIKMQQKITDEVAAMEKNYSDKAFINKDGELAVRLDIFNRIKSGFWGRAKGWTTADDKIYNDVYFQLGHTAKEMIEDSVSNVNIKALNKRIGDFISAINLLDKRRGAPVKGGQLNRYFARAVGAIVGSHGGPVGSVTGAITADQIVDVMQNPKYTTAMARAVINRAKKEAPDVLRQAEEKLRMNAEEALTRKLLPAPAALGTPRNPHITPQYKGGASGPINAATKEARQQLHSSAQFQEQGQKLFPLNPRPPAPYGNIVNDATGVAGQQIRKDIKHALDVSLSVEGVGLGIDEKVAMQSPKFVKGRIDDAAMKFDKAFPGKGLGDKFRNAVKGLTSLKQMREKAMELLKQSNGGGANVLGAFGGVQKDEEGNTTFDSKKAAAYMVGVAALTRRKASKKVVDSFAKSVTDKPLSQLNKEDRAVLKDLESYKDGLLDFIRKKKATIDATIEKRGSLLDEGEFELLIDKIEEGVDKIDDIRDLEKLLKRFGYDFEKPGTINIPIKVFERVRKTLWKKGKYNGSKYVNKPRD